MCCYKEGCTGYGYYRQLRQMGPLMPRRALGILRVPTVEEERACSHTRQRATLQKEPKRRAAIGRSHMLNYDHVHQGDWWRPRVWQSLQSELPAWLIELLAPWQRIFETIHRASTNKWKQEVQAEASPVEARPKGLGAMSEGNLLHEVSDAEALNQSRPSQQLLLRAATRRSPAARATCGWLPRPSVQAFALPIIVAEASDYSVASINTATP